MTDESRDPAASLGSVGQVLAAGVDDFCRRVWRLTDAERQAVRRASRIVESREAMEEFTADDAGALLGLLERLG